MFWPAILISFPDRGFLPVLSFLWMQEKLLVPGGEQAFFSCPRRLWHLSSVFTFAPMESRARGSPHAPTATLSLKESGLRPPSRRTRSCPSPVFDTLEDGPRRDASAHRLASPPKVQVPYRQSTLSMVSHLAFTTAGSKLFAAWITRVSTQSEFGTRA